MRYELQPRAPELARKVSEFPVSETRESIRKTIGLFKLDECWYLTDTETGNRDMYSSYERALQALEQLTAVPVEPIMDYVPDWVGPTVEPIEYYEVSEDAPWELDLAGVDYK